MRFTNLVGFCTVLCCASGIAADAPLFPFMISYGGADNASSVAKLLPTPAGRDGQIRIVDGRFVNDAGPVRLHGTNLTGPANFPTHADADKLAERLARLGINCVRLHYFDTPYGNFMTPALPGIIAADPETQLRLDSEQRDRQDYLVAALKKRGIYTNMNLHVGRQLDKRDGIDERTPWANKGVDSFYGPLIQHQKDYARELLTRVNPYTGMAYTDDPCVAMIEINNENALWNQYGGGGLDWLGPKIGGEFRRQWNDWLKAKYGTDDARRAAWAWKPEPLHDEQIAEGRFDAPVDFTAEPWVIATGQSGAASAEVRDGVLHLTVTRRGEEYYPKLYRGVSVKAGQNYTLSFRVRRVDGRRVELSLGVAQTAGGWKSLGLVRRVMITDAWREILYSFEATEDSDLAQVQITRFVDGEYEIDNLSLQSGVHEQYRLEGTLAEGTVPIIRSSAFAPKTARLDFARFLCATEDRYWHDEMYLFLRDELKCRAVVSGTQLGYSPPPVQARLDYVDHHSYWCHPGPVNKDWRIRNESMVNSLSCVRSLAAQRVAGKPFTVSEYNHPFPNLYGAEGQPMLRAYGRFQGWDGVFEYTYNHGPDFEPPMNSYFFSIIARTDVLAHFPACATMYLRGDVEEARQSLIAVPDQEKYLENLASSSSVGQSITHAGFHANHPLVHKCAVAFSGENAPAPESLVVPAGPVISSDTGELIWNRDIPDACYWLVNTPNTKLFSGFPRGRAVDLGEVSLAVGDTRLGWATVSLLSHDATGFGAAGPARILLAATGYCGNDGMVIAEHAPKLISLTDWGKGPVVAEGIPAELTLKANADRVRCYALDGAGERKGEVPVQAGPEGAGAKIVIGPDYQTVWYEIIVR